MQDARSSHWIWNFIQLPQFDVHSSSQLLGEPI